MSNPATDPAPADPTTDPANPDPVTDPATPPADPPADPDPADGDEDARVKRANAQAAKYRTELRETQQALAKQGETLAALAAVFNPDAGEQDPAAAAAAATSEAERARTELAQAKAELLVHTIAGDNGGNPVALLDSRTFADKLHGLDPSAEDYAAQVAEAIKAAVSSNANLSTGAGQGPARGGAPGAGQGPAQPAGAVTQEQFNAMDYDARAELYSTNPELYRRLAGTAT